MPNQRMQRACYNAADARNVRFSTMVKKVAKIAFGTLGVVAAFVLCGVIYIIATVDSPPFPLQRLEQLTSGMTKAEVEGILGTPDSVYEDGSKWAYSRTFSWPIVYIRFNDEGRFKESEYDF